RGTARGARQSYAEGGRYADRGRAADDECADRVGDVFPARVLALDLAGGEQRLVEEHEPAGDEADRRDGCGHWVRSAPHQPAARRSAASMSAFSLKFHALPPSRSSRPSTLNPSGRVSPLSQAPPL